MSIFANKLQVLEMLVENLKNSQPEVVNSRHIANKLKMSEKDTCQLMKIMHQMGVVISDSDGQRSLITQTLRRNINLITPQTQPIGMEGCELFVSRVSAAMDGCSEASRDGFTASRETNSSHPGSVAEH